MTDLPSVLLRHLFTVIGMASLIASWLLLIEITKPLTDVTRLDRIDIWLPENSQRIIGNKELKQPDGGATSKQHIAFQRTPGGISAFDVSHSRRIGFRDSTNTYDETVSLALKDGLHEMRIGNVVFSLRVDGTQLILSETSNGTDASKITYFLGGTEPKVQFPTYTHTPEKTLLEQLSHQIDGLGAIVGEQTASYRIGGEYTDAQIPFAFDNGILPVTKLPSGSAQLVFKGGGLDFKFSWPPTAKTGTWVVKRGVLPVSVRKTFPAVLRANNVSSSLNYRQWVDAEARPIPVLNAKGDLMLRTLTLGRTEYDVKFDQPSDMLTLQPTKRRVWLSAGQENEVGSPGIRAKLSSPKPRLTQLELRNCMILVAICTGMMLLFTIGATLKGGRAAAIAALGLYISIFSDMQLHFLAISAIGAGFAVLGFFAAFLTRFHNFTWRVLWFSLGIAGTAFAGFPIIVELALGDLGNISLNTNPLAVSLAGTWLALGAFFLAPTLGPASAFFWSLYVSVAGFAAVAGTRLVLIEPTERWLQLLDRHLMVLAGIGLVAALILGIAHEGGGTRLRRLILPKGSRKFVQFVVFVIGLGFALTTLVGDETGFFGVFQPSEIAKSLLVVVVAITLTWDLAKRTMLSASDGALDLGPLVLSVILVLAILLASALNYDMSPILVSAFSIYFALTAGALLHAKQMKNQKTARRRLGLPILAPKGWISDWPEDKVFWLLRRKIRLNFRFWPVFLWPLVSIGLLLGAAFVATEQSFRKGESFQMISFMETPWKRAQSWHEMAIDIPAPMIEFPETGLQLRLAREAMLEAGCTLDLPLCPAGLPRALPHILADEALLRVPAIQDDFAAVALIHVLGVDGAILYFIAQAGLIFCAFGIGLMGLFTKGDMRLGGWLLGCATIGLTSVVAAQFILAWGNVLGFFPIMGQPMTFVSFGASHHIGVAFPFACVTLMSAIASGQPSNTYVETRALTYRRSRQP